jgi:Zn-dependent peptidase ImmA (M78 family)
LYWREAAREIYEKLHEDIPIVRAAADLTEEPETVGARIRQSLGITWQTQIDWNSPSAALNTWRSSIENLGVLVFQAGSVGMKEMRAISIPSGPLPVILLNNSDSPHGRIFSLLHEFAHVLLANAGHRPSTIEQARAPEDQVLERVSNAFAAATLMPEAEFLKEATRYREAATGDELELLRFADRIKVSPEAILRRFVSLNRISLQIYRAKRREWQRRDWRPFEKGKWGPPVETRIVSAAGRVFVSLVLQGYQRNAVSSSDASDYLGVQLKYLDRIAQHLRERPSATAA